MRTKHAMRIALHLVLIGLLLLASNAVLTGISVKGLSSGSAGTSPPLSSSRLFFQQNFDNETVGSSANGWTVLPGSAGSLTVENTVDYVSQGLNSAQFIDNSNTSSVVAYRYFYPRNDTIVFSFSLYFLNNTLNTTGLEVSVDDGGFNGANIIFKNGTIQYYDGHNGLVLLQIPFVTNKWYRIMFIMNIPTNTYDIHVDDHLEITGASFNGSCTEIQRIAITEYYPPGSMNVAGFIDDIIGFGAIIIPTDYPTIQAGIDAASPGDVIYVTGPRVYFENIMIPSNKNGVWLVGQNTNAAVLDGRFATAVPDRISLNGCSNVTVYGFTINMSSAQGAQLSVTGSGNTVEDNVIINGLGDGIQVAGSNMNIVDNVIQLNEFGFGINLVSGQDNFVYNNTITRNMGGLECGKTASNNLIFGNRFVANNQQAVDNGASNMWNDGYPYVPQNMTGGGNYWSDFTSCTDIYSGPGQDIGPNCTIPSPDGICDQPYPINGTAGSLDNYPLFLIQNVTQSPPLTHANCANEVYDKSVQYDTPVTVSVTTLQYVQVTNATLYVNYTSSDGSTGNMTISGKIASTLITFTIPGFPYNTTVRYVIKVLADGSSWLNSTYYPIPFPYFVDDMTGPIISDVEFVPSPPDANQTVTIYANVSEPLNASGVDKVYVSYTFNVTVWTAQMTNIGDSNWSAIIPAQQGGIKLNFTITAIDKAGNLDGNINGTTYVQKLAQMSVTPYPSAVTPPPPPTPPYDPCIVDFGTGSGDQIYTNGFTITNLGTAVDDGLAWNIYTLQGGSWFSLNATPPNGVLPGGGSVNIQVTVDTSKCLDPITGAKAPGLYAVELEVSSNGTISQWGVVIRITVSDIIIDQSAVYPASSEWPNRVNLGSNQTVAFHAEWAINSLPATNGQLTIAGTNSYPAVPSESVNSSGWATFVVPSPATAKIITFSVKAVKFGNVTSFWQTSQNRIICWDRVNITLSMANNYVDVDSAAQISWNGSTYESDKTPFNTTSGFVNLNDSLTRDHVDEAKISASSIVDYAYPEVTAFDSNSVDVIWDEIRIIQGGVSNTKANSGQFETVWFIAIYERENTLFRGENGTMFVNVTIGNDTSKVQLSYSFDDLWDWQRVFNYTSGTVTFQVSGIEDNVHHLTKIQDGVGLLNITWGPNEQSFWSQWFQTNTNDPTQNDPSQPAVSTQTSSSYSYVIFAVILAVTVALGVIFTLLLLMSARKKPKSTAVLKKNGQTNQSLHRRSTRKVDTPYALTPSSFERE